MGGNKYLAGNFAPVEREVTATALRVTGTIPEHLDGRYVRNGPNPIGEVDPATYHWFMGDGMVHGVRLRDGRAEWYRNRWVRTSAMASASGEPFPDRPHRAGLELIGANTNVIRHAGRALALIEGGMACYELGEELETLGPWDFGGALPGGYTAHPKRDPATGELHAVTHFFGMGDHVRYSVIGASGRVERVVDIEVAGSPMMHDLAITERHVLFFDLPVTFAPRPAVELIGVPRPLRAAARLVLSALIGRVRVPEPVVTAIGRRMRPNHRLPFGWDPDHPARVGVMPRDGGPDDVRWFDVEPCYVYHPLNAYDEDDRIVLDVVRHPKMFATDLDGPDEGAATLDRWTVDLGADKVIESTMDDHPQEFPRVDERLVGRRHRFGYAMRAVSGGIPANAVLKHDLVRGTTTAVDLGAGREASEFVFVPACPDAAEDEGTLMGFAYDTRAQRSDLVLLDAGTLETAAVVHLPERVPNGFHGNWLPTVG